MALASGDSGSEIDDEPQVTRLEPLNLLQDYFQSPVFTINLEIQQIFEHVKAQIDEIKFQEAPYFPQTYGEIRKEAYLKFTQLIEQNYRKTLRQHKKIFHDQIDTKGEEYFNQKWSINDQYSNQIERQKTKGSILKVKREYDFNYTELTLDLLNAEVSGLVQNWHTLIDQAVDVFERFEMYEIKDVCNFRELFVAISENQKQKPSPTWAEWFKEGVFGLGWIKGMFGGNKTNSEESQCSNGDMKELYEQMMMICCGQVVLGYFKNTDYHFNMKILIKMKGYMMLLTQNMEAYLKAIKDSIEIFLENNSKEIDIENQKNFNETIDLFVNSQDNLTAFDEGFFKNYFKDDPKENSTRGTFLSSDE